MKGLKKVAVRRVVIGLVLVLGIMMTTGCVPSGLGGDYGYGYGFPASGLYDPTNDIQSVIGYRQSVMDWSNDAWDAYIRE